ncbi:MAG: hypothetical protein GX929_09435 [Clostridiales bacterium]|nr:hypothetical protein [Clostridiales bacterium]
MNRETTLSMRKFIMTYIVPMFTIALILVLVSYLKDVREQETREQLEMLDTALAERDARITELETRIRALEEKLAEQGEDTDA